MTTVLVAEDDPLTLAGIELLLANSNFKLAGVASSGVEVIDRLPSVRPDILVLDVNMPERTGLEVLRLLRSRGDQRPIVLLTGGINDSKALEAMKLGVNGLVIKSAAPRDLLTCLEAVAQGRRWLDQEVMQRTMDMTLTGEDGPRDPLQALSPRERAITGLVARGLRNKEIGAELGLTEGTVKVHLHKIFEKLSVRSRTELILIAQENSDN